VRGARWRAGLSRRLSGDQDAEVREDAMAAGVVLRRR
jgi:hypothetical protein